MGVGMGGEDLVWGKGRNMYLLEGEEWGLGPTRAEGAVRVGGGGGEAPSEGGVTHSRACPEDPLRELQLDTPHV